MKIQCQYNDNQNADKTERIKIPPKVLSERSNHIRNQTDYMLSRTKLTDEALSDKKEVNVTVGNKKTWTTPKTNSRVKYTYVFIKSP